MLIEIVRTTCYRAIRCARSRVLRLPVPAYAFTRRLQSSLNNQSVCVIGAGPSGLLVSNLLSRFGVDHILIDRNICPTNHPQAHFINNRSMEILRDWLPNVYSKIIKQSPPPIEWRDFAYSYSLTGHTFTRTDQFSSEMTSPLYWNESPTGVTHLPQYKFETILHDELHAVPFQHETPTQSLPLPSSTVSPPFCRTLFGYELDPVSSSFIRHPFRISLNRVAPRSSDTNYNYANNITLYPKYVVAADGSNSMIRRLCNVKLSGKEQIQQLLNVHFECPGLRDLLKPRPAMLHFIFNERAVCVMVAHDPAANEWVCQIPMFNPPASSSSARVDDMLSTEEIMDILQASIGQPIYSHHSTTPSSDSNDECNKSSKIDKGLCVKILSVRKWYMHAQVADTFSYCSHSHVTQSAYNSTPKRSSGNEGCNTDKFGGSRSNREDTNCTPSLFLIGDAAHRFPPAGGFGMNTGLQDAHNLAWKLSLVVKGLASDHLLHSYNLERKSVAEANTKLSLVNFDKTARTAATLGADPVLANLAVHSVDAIPAPYSVKKQLLNQALRLGLKPLAALKVNTNLYCQMRLALLKRLQRNGGMLPLMFPTFDLDFDYSLREPVRNVMEPLPLDYKTPRLREGARLPHFWLMLLQQPDMSDSAFTVASRGVTKYFASSTSLASVIHKIYSVCVEANLRKLAPQFVILVGSKHLSEQWIIELNKCSLSQQSLFSIVEIGSSTSIMSDHETMQGILSSSPIKLSNTAPQAELKWIDISSVEPTQHRAFKVPPVSISNVKVTLWVDVTRRWEAILSLGGIKPECAWSILVRPDGHVASIAHSEVLDEKIPIEVILKFWIKKFVNCQ